MNIMTTQTMMGTITFINHDKEYATIAYEFNNKKKTINGDISERSQLKLKAEKIIRKTHSFHVGDEVSFIIVPSPKGDRMVADAIEFKFNNALDNLINKSAVENRFVGYLKKVGEEYFVKETGSYIFFPLKLSPWERHPQEGNLNEPFFFKLENTDKPGKATAAPFKSTYIHEYLTALQCYKNKTPVEATVNKITPHGIFVNMFGNKIHAKIPFLNKSKQLPVETELKAGDVIKVIITYLGSSRITIEQV